MKSPVELGLALGLVIGIAIIVAPWGPNDFSAVFRVAGRAVEPYDVNIYWDQGIFAYPLWNVYVLRPVSLLPPGVGLACIYVLSVGVVLALAPSWGTPAWVVLLSPVFLKGLFYGQPFEAFAFAGLTLVAAGREGLGLCLLAFKPQIGFVPAMFVILRKPRAVLLSVVMALVVTGVDFVLSGRLWIGPWRQMLAAQANVPWNDALWRGLGVFSLMWIPVGLWLLGKVRGNTQKELWVVTAVGLLCMPYWTSISLWPLVAMAGCLGRSEEASDAEDNIDTK